MLNELQETQVERGQEKSWSQMGLRKMISIFGPPLLMIYTFIGMTPTSTRNDPDTFFHITLGRAMIQQGHVIHEAIQSFAGDHIPYVTHEVGFQLIAGGLYQLGEWRGLHFLTVLCLGFLFWGLFRLVKVARREEGMKDVHPFLVFLLPVFLLLIFHMYFKIRPQMASAPIVVWFLVVLREFQLQPSLKRAIGLGLLSFLLANVHTGVWPVIAVFFVMNGIEAVWERKWSKWHSWSLFFIFLGGLLNTGGWNTLVYFQTLQKTGFLSWISEWQPINFAENKLIFGVLLVYFWSAIPVFQKRGLFRKFFFIGILYLGLVNYKEHLYLILFLPYFFANSVDRVKWLDDFKWKPWMLKRSFLCSVIGTGLFINLMMGLFTPYKAPLQFFPVEEMDYILQHHPDHPKVLSVFHTGSYVIFRGGESLADGRFDPFVTKESKGIHGWTAFERVNYAFGSGEVISILDYDHPDYFIFPNGNGNLDEKPKVENVDSGWTSQDIAHAKVKEVLGAPVFVGSYGEVYQISK